MWDMDFASDLDKNRARGRGGHCGPGSPEGCETPMVDTGQGDHSPTAELVVPAKQARGRRKVCREEGE